MSLSPSVLIDDCPPSHPAAGAGPCRPPCVALVVPTCGPHCTRSKYSLLFSLPPFRLAVPGGMPPPGLIRVIEVSFPNVSFPPIFPSLFNSSERCTWFGYSGVACGSCVNCEDTSRSRPPGSSYSTTCTRSRPFRFTPNTPTLPTLSAMKNAHRGTYLSIQHLHPRPGLHRLKDSTASGEQIHLPHGSKSDAFCTFSLGGRCRSSKSKWENEIIHTQGGQQRFRKRGERL